MREEWPFRTAEDGPTGADKLASFTGRSFPSPLAIHGTELFWTNDDGVFVLPQRDVKPERYVQLQTQDERHELYRRAIKLQPDRLDIPRRRPNLFKFNEWLVNTEGATVFIPVSDVTRQCISAMLLYFDRPHGYYIVDKQLGNDPLRPFVRLRAPRVRASGRPLGLRALADGGHERRRGGPRRPEPDDRDAGARDRRASVLGRQGPRHARRREALARDRRRGTVRIARLHVPPGPRRRARRRRREIPVGLEGIFEGACPPFHPDMDAAVDHVLELRWGEEESSRRPGASRSPGARRRSPARSSPVEEAIEATKTLCRYIWDTYGRFPATIDPFVMTVWYQAAHLDVDFYDRLLPAGGASTPLRSHMRDWHGL